VKKTIIYAVAAMAVASFSVSTSASVLISDNFTRVTPVENVIAPFFSNAGATTSGTFTGFVEILVSGRGFSLGNLVNDAFYLTQSGQGLGGNFYHLGLGTMGQPWNAFSPNFPSLGVERFMSYIDGVGSVAAWSIPAFNSSSTYNFVIDLSAQSSPLTFGVLDGAYVDNGGSFALSIWQLRAGVAAVPEPATWLLMISGFGAIGTMVRRKKRLMLTARSA
jgi:PEP-CTERM motif